MNKLLISLLTLLATHLPALGQLAEIEHDMFESMLESDKAVIVAVHTGAEDATAQQQINRFNTRLKEAYPNYDFREAWTTRDLIKQSGDDSPIKTPDELFSQLKKDGYTHVLVQSSNIINCAEMQFLRYAVETAKENFKQIRLGEPLLSTPADYEHAIKAMAAAYGNEKEANILMCSGTASVEDSQYAMLDYTLKDQDFKEWFVGTVDGYLSLESLKKQLKTNKIKKVHIIPFTFAQSSQTTASTIKEWAQNLQEAGYKVTTELRCLGDLDAIMDIFEKHIKHAEKFRRYSAKEMKMIAR